MAQLSTKRVLSIQEEKLVSLRKQHKTLLKRVNTERGKLQRFKEEIQRIASTFSGAVQQKMQALHTLQADMQDVLERCAQSKLFSKAERKDFHWMKEDLHDMFADMMPPEMSEEGFRDFMREQAEERAKMGFDFFNHFAPPVPEEQQRSIREVYKRLAAKFHPDKAAGNTALEKRFHSIMQRINTAYQHGDIADLIAIEAEFADVEDILNSEESALRDLVEQEIERLLAELDLCQGQLARLKDERKKIERTQEGKLVKDFQKAVKLGIDPIEEMTRDIDRTISELTFQKDLYEQLLSGKITREEFERLIDARVQEHPHPLDDAFGEDEIEMLINEAIGELFQEMERNVQRKQAKSRTNTRSKRSK